MNNMAVIKFKVKNGWHITPCPYGEKCFIGIISVGSMVCLSCEYNRSFQFKSLKDDETECGKVMLGKIIK
jgi:hypothetical protein